jgi:hypothetical protein
MRKGLVLLAPFAVVASLHVACSSEGGRSFTPAAPSATATGFGTTPPPPVDPNAPKGCSESQTEIARIPVAIDIIVDKSSSMVSDNKWTSATAALLAALEDMKATADPATFVGLTFFGESVGPNIDLDTLTNASHASELLSTVKNQDADGFSTNTGGALQESYSKLESFVPPQSTGLVGDQMKRVAVLLSDGLPNGSMTKEQVESLIAKKLASTTKPIQTFSVGIGPFPNGSGYDAAFMGRVAVKGGTSPAGCKPDATTVAKVCHFQITPGQNATATKQALIDALTKIRALSASCEFEFTLNDRTDLSNVKVEITDKDGNKLALDKDPDNGWSFDDEQNPTKIVLKGDACSASSGTLSGRVDVVVGCKGAN